MGQASLRIAGADDISESGVKRQGSEAYLVKREAQGEMGRIHEASDSGAKYASRPQHDSVFGTGGARMKITNFRDLDVWTLGKEIVLDIYRATDLFPKGEVYGLTAQMRRAAVSIPSNVAEGFNRFHNKEYRQFLYIALGSCAELETQVEIAKDLGYLERKDRDGLIDQVDHETRMLRNLIKKL